jgi:hypothetical protein
MRMQLKQRWRIGRFRKAKPGNLLRRRRTETAARARNWRPLVWPQDRKPSGGADAELPPPLRNDVPSRLARPRNQSPALRVPRLVPANLAPHLLAIGHALGLE